MLFFIFLVHVRDTTFHFYCHVEMKKWEDM